MNRAAQPGARPPEVNLNDAFKAIVRHRQEYLRRLAARFGGTVDCANVFGDYLLWLWERSSVTQQRPVTEKAYVHRALRYRAISELRRQHGESKGLQELAIEFDDGNDRNHTRRA